MGDAAKSIDHDLDPEQRKSEELIDAWAARRGKWKQGISLASVEAAKGNARDLMRTGDGWARARPIDFVALCLLMHEHVYKVAPTMTATERTIACAQASRAIKDRFAGDRDAFATYLRWAWNRELGRERWRRQNMRPGKTISWRLLFCSSEIVNEWRVDEARARER